MRIIQSPSPVSLSLHKVVTSNISFFCMKKASFLQLEAMDFRLDGYDHNSLPLSFWVSDGVGFLG